MVTVKKVFIAAGLLALLGVVLWASLRNGEGRGVLVEVEEATVRELTALVKATGEVNPRRKVEIQAKVIGEIVDLPVVEGQEVRTGQVVLQIERELYVAARDQARASRDQARVNLERTRADFANARLNLERARSLHADKVLSEEALERTELAFETAEIGVRAQQEVIRQAESAYRRASEDLERTTIRAPMDGVVTALNVEKGETAIMGTMNFPGSVLMIIGDLSELLVEVDVAESEVVEIALGQETNVLVDAVPDVAMTGRVVEIGSSGLRQGDVVRFRVKVVIEEPDDRIRPGMTARVEIRTAREGQAVTVPQQAVQTRWLDADGKEVSRRAGDETQREATVVYLLGDGAAERREVTTGIHDELRVQIVEGLTAGEQVIVGPYRVLRDLSEGDRVRRQESSRAGGR